MPVLLFSAIISFSNISSNNSVFPALISITSGQKPHSASIFFDSHRVEPLVVSIKIRSLLFSPTRPNLLKDNNIEELSLDLLLYSSNIVNSTDWFSLSLGNSFMNISCPFKIL